MDKKRINTFVWERGHSVMLADGFEDAFLGLVESKGSAPKACYDREKCINILEERDGMPYLEAVEFLDFKVTDAYVGESTPSFLERIDGTLRYEP